MLMDCDFIEANDKNIIFQKKMTRELFKQLKTIKCAKFDFVGHD
jgi:hypothetical protein